MAEATQRYILTTTVRLAELHCSARKRQLQSAARAHAGVECPHADVTAGGPRVARGRDRARIHGCTDVRPRAVHESPVGDVYLSTGLYCTCMHAAIKTVQAYYRYSMDW